MDEMYYVCKLNIYTRHFTLQYSDVACEPSVLLLNCASDRVEQNRLLEIAYLFTTGKWVQF
jgi:hypothetical protein